MKTKPEFPNWQWLTFKRPRDPRAIALVLTLAAEGKVGVRAE